MAWTREKDIPDPPIKPIVSLAVFVYFSLILFTSVWIIHESPESAFPELAVETSTLTDIVERGVSPGFTYGDMNTSFLAQVNPILIITVLFFSGILSAIFYFALSKHNITKKGAKWWVSLFHGVGFGLLYAIMFLAFLIALPRLNYITITGNSLPVEAGIFRASTTFFILIMINSVMVASVAVIWSRPIVPKETMTNFIHNNENILEYHLEHWMQYYSWIIAIFGGTLATILVLYVVEMRQFQTSFILHISIVIGGAMGIIFLFVIYKIITIEKMMAYKLRSAK